jgi:hypothetical protein
VIQTAEAAFLVLLAGAISLSSRPLSRQLVFPLGGLALAIAAVRGSAGPAPSETLATLPAGFRAVTAGLLLIGIFGTILVAIRAGRLGLWHVPGAIAAIWAARPLLAAAPFGPSLLAALVIVMIAMLALAIGRLWGIRSWVVEADRRWLGSPGRATNPTSVGIVFLVGGTLCTMLAPHLSLVFAGATAASWSVGVMARQAGIGRLVVPTLVTALLGITYIFLATVAGSEGLSMAGLDALPISPAAELLVAAALLAASWLMCGLWPLHALTSAPLVAPATIAVLARVSLVAAPAGMEHWRPLAVPLGMLALWHAAARRWGPGLAAAAAWLAIVSVAPAMGGGIVAAWLLPAGLALEVLGDKRDGETQPRRWVRWVALLAMGWGGFLALDAGLHGEVVYTVLAGMGVVLGIGGSGQAMTPSAPRTPAPSA